MATFPSPLVHPSPIGLPSLRVIQKVHLNTPWWHPLLHCCWSICQPNIPSLLGMSENHLRPSLDYMLDAGVSTWASAMHKWSLLSGWPLYTPHPSSFTLPPSPFSPSLSYSFFPFFFFSFSFAFMSPLPAPCSGFMFWDHYTAQHPLGNLTSFLSFPLLHILLTLFPSCMFSEDQSLPTPFPV